MFASAHRVLHTLFSLLLTAEIFADPAPESDFPSLTPIESGDPLPGTELLDWEGDLTMKMVEGAHRFLDQKLTAAQALRDEIWRDVTPAGLEEIRAQFRLTIGLRDTPAEHPTFTYLHTSPSTDPSPIHKVRWPAFADVTGVGHLFLPSAEPAADLILLLAPGHGETAPLIRRLLAQNIRVLVPSTIPRENETRGLPTREWLHRPAFEFGRTLTGYEVQKILSAAKALRASQTKPHPVAIAGTGGDHGMLALFAAAAAEPDTFHTVLTGGFFRPLEALWRGPADHNFFGLLNAFGAAEVAALTSPQKLLVLRSPISEPAIPAGGKAKPTVPGDPPSPESIRAESDRASALLAKNPPAFFDSDSPYDVAAWDALTHSLGAPDPAPIPIPTDPASPELNATFPPVLIDEQIHELDRHTQSLLSPSRNVRAQFMADLDFASPEAFAKSQEPYRRNFAEDVIGEFPDELLPPHPRSRPYQKGTFTTSYEVVLDVLPDLFAYGILTVPDEIKPGEKLPVVVCQHGLEGRPQSVVGELQHESYKAFATHLAERGFITFAPQNLYTGKDRFRLLQFKANPLGKTLFSLMVPQHQQIVDWLGTLENVDPERIAFYGLSYGGKSAMRIPPLVPGYCLSICSADFNEWVWKNTSTDSPYSYVDKNEYEIFEWNLGNTFNYAEMAALIAPRPFMVERGHFDGVAPDEMVAFEFAKVRHLYQAKLGIGDRAEIEWFVGPHTINGKATYKFLDRHLKPHADAAALPLEIGGIKFGIPVPGRPGLIRSPHALEAGLIDVRDLPPGTKIRCPFSDEVIAIPAFPDDPDAPPRIPEIPKIPKDPF